MSYTMSCEYMCLLYYNIHIPQALISDSDSSLSNCRKVESVKWSRVAKSEFVVSECAAYGTAPQEAAQYYVVPDAAVPEATNQPEEAYEVPDAVQETNQPQETEEAVYEWIPGDPQQ